MPDELVLGVVVLDEEELVLGEVLGVVLEDELLGVVEPEAPIEPLEELLGVLLEDDGVLDEDEDEGGLDDEPPAPMAPEPALSPPAFGAVELELLLVPVPLLEVPTPEAEEPDEPDEPEPPEPESEELPHPAANRPMAAMTAPAAILR